MRAAIAIAIACLVASASAAIYEIDEYTDSNCMTVQDKSYYGGGTCVEFHDSSTSVQSLKAVVDGTTMMRSLYTSTDCSGDSTVSVQSTQGTCSSSGGSGSSKFVGASDQTFLKVNLYSDSSCGTLVTGPGFVPLGCHIDKPNKYDLVTATDSSATIASFNASTCTGAAATNTTTATATFGQCLTYRADDGINSILIFGYSNGAAFAAPSVAVVLLAAAAALFARNH